MVNDAYFIRDCLELERVRLRVASSTGDSIIIQHSQASLFETFLWLHLGVEIEYFDRDVAEHLLKTIYQPELFSQLRARQRQFEVHTPEFQAEPVSQRYNPTFFQLSRLFPALEPLLGRCVNEQEVFAFFKANVRTLYKMRPLFQCLYAASRTMCEDVAAQNFITAINFCNDTQWSNLMKEKISGTELFKTMTDPS